MIFIVSDHGGVDAKAHLVRWLKSHRVPVVDVGPACVQTGDDYPEWAARLARQVQKTKKSMGLALCRSGIGMAMVANKFSGIRAAQAFTPSMAAQSRRDEDTNILSLAADYHSQRELRAIVRAWLTTKYKPTVRFQRRLREVRALDHGR
ncbi:MAG: RpiB/LacA/LacB family sugar-phosphate isomerase [Patescibacteria group bacterium]